MKDMKREKPLRGTAPYRYFCMLLQDLFALHFRETLSTSFVLSTISRSYYRPQSGYSHKWLTKYITHPDDEDIQKPVQTGPFEGGLSAVHHEFSVATGENDQTVAPAGVAQNRPS